jgi:predicted transposase/invertase (TIGR01784 family)
MSKPFIGRYARIIMDDWFKRAFGTESRKRLLQLFLQELIPEHHIVNLTYTNSEHINPFPGKKDVRIDVECSDEDGTRFIVEVQVAPQRFFYERALFNSTFAIQQQKDKGEDEYDFPSVYFIGLMDFTLHEGTERVDFRYALREALTGELMTSRIQYIFLELPNSLLTALKPGASVLQNICYALHMMEHLTEQPDGLKEEIFRLLFDSAEIANFTPEEKVKYEQNMTTERDIRNQISYARDLGREEGREEGAREQSLLIARNLLQAGIPADVVVRATGLSAEEVQGCSLTVGE